MNTDSLYQLLECPICYASMKPPIRQCKIGHTFCDCCRQRITSCPICRGDISSSRAFHLEKISQTTYICKKCNKAIPLHSYLAHKDSCLNGSGDTNGERLDSISELNNYIQITEFGNELRTDENSNSSSSGSSSPSVYVDSSDHEGFSDNYMIVADSSSENYVTSSDDGQIHIGGGGNIFNYVEASSYEDEDNISNGEYDAGNDGDESGEADSSVEEEEEENVEEEEDFYEEDISDEYDGEDADVSEEEEEEEEEVSEEEEDEVSEEEEEDEVSEEEEDEVSEEEDEVSEEEDEVSEEEEDEVSEEEDEVSEEEDEVSAEDDELDSYYSDDVPQIIYDSDDTVSEGKGETGGSDSFFTTDEFDVSD